MIPAQLRLIGLLALVLAILGAGFGLYRHGVTSGTNAERGLWMKKEAARQDAERNLILQHGRDMAALQEQFNQTNVKVSANHEKELEQVRTAAARDRAAVDHAGGLRIPAPACRPIASAAEAAGAKFRDEVAAATVRLPPETENRLWDLANDADAVSAQLRACQAWITENGFYGTETAEKQALLGRMVADPNQDNEANK